MLLYSWNIRKEKAYTYNQHIGYYNSGMKNKYLSLFFFQKGNIIKTSGYSPIRHRTCAGLTILKRRMEYDFKYQRKIVILHSELSQINKK